MKLKLLAFLFPIFFLALLPGQALSQAKQSPRQQAAPGDTVWVVVNTVKADKRAQFEHFLHDIFWPGAAKLSKKDQLVFRQTRIMHPVAAEADGTYSYLFIMDPIISGSDYEIEHLLTRMYGAAKAKEHMKVFREAIAREFKLYKVVQSRH